MTYENEDKERAIRDFLEHISSDTGISKDYVNEWTGLRVLLSNGHGERAKDILKKRYIERGFTIPTYETRFPSSIFPNVVNRENRKRVYAIDVPAGCIDYLVESDMLNLVHPDDLLSICERAIYLITGNEYTPSNYKFNGSQIPWERDIVFRVPKERHK